VAKITLVHAVDTTTSLGSSHCVAMSGVVPTTSILSLIAASLVATYDVTLKSMLNASGVLTLVRVKDLSQPAVLPGEALDGSVGTRAGVIPTLATCACMVGRPERSYRGSRPKSFMPFGCESDTVGANVWSSSFITAMESAWTEWLAGIAATSVDGTNLGAPVSVSYFGPPTIPNPDPRGRARFTSTLRDPPLVTAISNYELSPTLGSQRRRLRAV
jgi:hypothetical protein